MFYQKAAVMNTLGLKSRIQCFCETLGLYAPLRIHPSAMRAKPCCKHGFSMVKFWNCQSHITC